MKIIGSTSAWKGSLDDALAGLAGLGFKEVDLIGIESWGMVSLPALVEDYETESRRVMGALSRHNLRAVSMNVAFKPDLGAREDANGNQTRLDQVRAVARLMQELGIGIAAHYPGYISDFRNDPEGVWTDTTTTLREIQETVADLPLTLAPELHYKTPFEKPEDARRLLAEIPELPYTYEPSHFIVQGIDVRETAGLLDGASHVHLRGCGVDRLQAPLESCRDELKWVVDRLTARSYNGMISLEYLPEADFDTKKDLVDLRETLDTWIA